jgi:putative ABC transport system ATP-binding protein
MMILETVLKIQQLSKTYYPRNDEPKEVLKGISLTVTEGERIAILGRSGSGKSTLLNLLALLDKGQGQITYGIRQQNKLQHYTLDNGNLHGISLDRLRGYLGFIFQTPFMLSNFDVDYNVGLPLHLEGFSVSKIHERVNKTVKDLELEEFRTKTADELSGGQRQRVAIGRALIHKPAIVFADEPTGNLDGDNAQNIMNKLEGLRQEQQTALVLVTHDPCLALNYTDKIYYLKQGQLSLLLSREKGEYQAHQPHCQDILKLIKEKNQ